MTKEEPKPLTVGEVARLANISVRTLHHYDAIGLLSASRRSEAGYRLYGEADLRRLHKVLAYRELGFELEAIMPLLDDPEEDDLEHLRRQEVLLDARLEKLLAIRGSLRAQMEARKMGINLNPKELLEVFGDEDPGKYAAEAEECWGNTDAYRQGHSRTKKYGKEDWLRINAETSAIETKFTELMAAGVPPTDARAVQLAEEHRRQICRNFYDCSYEVHRGLGEMYLADPRFTAYYEKRAEGLAAYVSAAVVANAEGR